MVTCPECGAPRVNGMGNAKEYAGSKRVRRPKEDRHPVLRLWPITIANVYLPDRPDGAAQRVRDWAAAIRREL